MRRFAGQIGIALVLSSLGWSAALAEPGPKTAEEVLHAVLERRNRSPADCFKHVINLQGPGEAPDFKQGKDSSETTAQRRLIVLVDASGSMAGSAGRETKMNAAKIAAERFLASVPEDVEAGLVAFGHRGTNDEAGKAESCEGIETILPVSTAEPGEISDRLAGFKARGWTPLAGALEHAGTLLADTDAEGEQVIYVVSDGRETCGGDPIAAAEALNTGNARAVVNVIGFDLPADERAQLRAIADAGGGTFSEARTAAELKNMDLSDGLEKAFAMSRVRGEAHGADLANKVGAGMAIDKAKACMNGILTGEESAVEGALKHEDLSPELQREVRDLLAERHERFRTMLRDYEQTHEADEAAAREEIMQRLREIENAYEDTRNGTAR